MRFSGNELLIGERMDYYSMADYRTGEDNKKTTFGTYCANGEWHFMFAASEDYFCPRHYNYNEPLYEGDIVEIMVTLGDKNRYLEVEVNQNGAEYCVLIENRDGKGDIGIKPLAENPIKSAVSVYKFDWTCDIILKKEALEKLGGSFDEVYFNAFRQDFDEKGNLSLYSLNPAKSDTFHITDAFIRAKFENKKEAQ